MYEGVVVPTVPHGVEAWDMRLDERHKLDVIEIEFLWSMSRVSSMERLRKDLVKRRVGMKENSDRFYRVFKWFGPVE